MAIKFDNIKCIVKNFADDVRCVFPVYKVILYGSYANGSATEDSDVDVCFLLNSFGEKNRHEVIVELIGMSHKYTDLYLEPVAFEVSEIEKYNPFLTEVLQTGIEIKY
jgi:predicted nucleotidyltransferase